MTATDAGTRERSAVRFGRTRIAYEVERTRRRKTVAIAVDAGGDVQLKAPPGTPIEKLDRIVRSRARWILERRRRLGDAAPRPAAREFASGETFLYLGRQYRLRVEPRRLADGRAGLRDVRMDRGWLAVPVPRGVAGAARRDRVRGQLTAWYRAAAMRRLPSWVDEWAPRLGVSAAGVLIRDQRARWGSCDAAGVLRLNWRIIQAAPRLQEYVIVHELAHLRERDHSRDFWAIVGHALPDYDTRRDRLRQVGPRLVW